MKFIITFFMLSLTMSSIAKSQKLEGRAFNEKGELVYIEKHEVNYQDKLVSSKVRYLRPDSDEILAELEINYAPSQILPNSKFQDLRTSRVNEISWIEEEQKIKVSSREDKDSDLKSTTIDVSQNLLSAHGINNFIRQNFDELSKEGASKKFKFVVPIRQEAYDFKVLPSKINETEVVFTIKVNNWFIRMFAPEIRLVFDKETKRIIRFEGLSNITKADGETQDVIVKYTYL